MDRKWSVLVFLIVLVITAALLGGWYLLQPKSQSEASPLAVFTYSPDFPLANETVTFDGSASTPNGGYIVSYVWDFGDGSPAVDLTDPITTHVYTAEGNYIVVLTVINSEGLSDTESKSITVQKVKRVNNPPTVTLLYPKGGEKLSGVVGVKWSASDPDNDVLSVTVQYTTDPPPFCPTCPPQRWHVISTSEENDGKFEWDTTKYPNGQSYQIKVMVIDGKYKAQAVSETLSVSN